MFELFESVLGKKRVTEARQNFDVASFIGPVEASRAKSKWEDAPEKDCLTAARKGDKSALNYIFIRCGGMIFKKFKTLTGPNSDFFRKAVSNGEYDDWVAEAYSLLAGGYISRTGELLYESPLKTFKDSLYKEGDLLNKFNYYYGQYLEHVAVKLRQDKNSGGQGTWGTDEVGNPIKNAKKKKGDKRELDPYLINWRGKSLNSHDDSNHDRGDAAGNYEDAELYSYHKDSGDEGYSEFSSEGVMDDIEADESLKGWRDLATDEELKPHDRAIIAALLRNPNATANEIAIAVDGSTKNHQAVGKVLKMLPTLFEIYNITSDGFSRLLTTGKADLMASIIEK